ncbi:unnamed protein product [Caenorhabditis bovis]|uniref:Phospholipid/glycerol acyltransferase domain-containing protein n=1 Tax=Caenorhabditis bovis TaxID=2654633 RepID=A0A8S1FE44_9PELO|nr:unnamed protein product [Caenorhabditis bovis]
MLILFLVYFYLSIVSGAFIATVTLIFCGLSWGQLPHLYLRLVKNIQQHFPKPLSMPLKRYESSTTNNDQSEDIISLPMKTVQNGISSIIEDDFGTAFETAKIRYETLLRFRPSKDWNKVQCSLFYLGLIFRKGQMVGLIKQSKYFRVSFLFPVRISLLISSFLFVSIAAVISAFKTLTNVEKTWVAIIYCRLFCCGMGLVAVFRNPENRPKRPGVAVANHLTPNDIQILFSGTPHGSSYGFVVTGVIEYLVEKLCPSLWLERKNSNERQCFLTEVLNIAKEEGPVLLFPEGYCSNNCQVLQFRKAIFEDGVNIYPIAIKQTPEFGDGFWHEDKFHMYLFRVMTSWAVVYDVQYLEVQRRRPDEGNVEFALRVQHMIAKAADIPCTKYGGSVWYNLQEREKLRIALQADNAKTLLDNEEPLKVDEIPKEKVVWDAGESIEKIENGFENTYDKLISVYS